MNGPIVLLDKTLSICYTFGMKKQSSFRISEQGRRLLAALAEANGVSQAAMLEFMIRDTAKKQGIHADSGLQTASEQGASSSH